MTNLGEFLQVAPVLTALCGRWGPIGVILSARGMLTGQRPPYWRRGLEGDYVFAIGQMSWGTR
jgi:hypothetical protein